MLNQNISSCENSVDSDQLASEKPADQNLHYFPLNTYMLMYNWLRGLSGRVLDSRPRGRGFEPHRRHCVVSLSKNINPSLVLVQPRKTRPFTTERLLMGRKESNQTNKKTIGWKLGGGGGNVVKSNIAFNDWIFNKASAATIRVAWLHGEILFTLYLLNF